MGALEIVSSLAVILALLIYYLKRKYLYWRDMGIPYEEPLFIYGNLKGAGTEFHLCQVLQKLYNKLKSFGAPFSGVFFFFSPVVLVTSLECAKNILVRDFAYFVDRGSYYNEDDGK